MGSTRKNTLNNAVARRRRRNTKKGWAMGQAKAFRGGKIRRWVRTKRGKATNPPILSLTRSRRTGRRGCSDLGGGNHGRPRSRASRTMEVVKAHRGKTFHPYGMAERWLRKDLMCGKAHGGEKTSGGANVGAWASQ